MLAYHSANPFGPSFWLDFADKAIKALALLVGALWTWRTYTLPRTSEPKSECLISGKIYEAEGKAFVHVTCILRNTGQTRYSVQHDRGTWVWAVPLSADSVGGSASSRPFWNPSGKDVFSDNSALLPGEEIRDHVLLPIPHPNDFVALQLNLSVLTTHFQGRSNDMIIVSDYLSKKESSHELEV